MTKWIIHQVEHGNQLMQEIAHIALDRATQRELGYPMWSDKKHVWFLCYSLDDEMKRAVGCCSMRRDGRSMIFGHDAVCDAHRGQGIYDALFKERLMAASQTDVRRFRAVCTPMSVGTFARYGFKVERESKNYTWMKMYNPSEVLDNSTV